VSLLNQTSLFYRHLHIAHQRPALRSHCLPAFQTALIHAIRSLADLAMAHRVYLIAVFVSVLLVLVVNVQHAQASMCVSECVIAVAVAAVRNARL
jgi:hypothetical protein